LRIKPQTHFWDAKTVSKFNLPFESLSKFLQDSGPYSQEFFNFYKFLQRFSKSIFDFSNSSSRVLTVEQDALMSPNPRGKLEDLVAGCVCVV